MFFNNLLMLCESSMFIAATPVDAASKTVGFSGFIRVIGFYLQCGKLF